MTSQKDLLDIQTKLENVTENETIERKKIENSPFFAIGSKKDGYHIICGTSRLTEFSIETLEEVDEYIEEKKWELIAQLVAIIVPRIMDEYKDVKEPF